ncbi:carboxylesterase/lipase family protein [Streptomyces sp. NPDC058246]|uniref:carboxylesterase/lipase family protein n=1 Tax=Streptomyces sp. NPDC058246 TaxID=3346400 RepID=UPI0036E57A8F
MTEEPGAATPLVQIPAGRLRGIVEGGVAVFKGVPYAAPPVSELRWRPAQPHPGWTGVREATDFGPSAPQMFKENGDPVLGEHGSPPFDDDCLTLNVWTPAVDDARRPVMVWIHGGGFVSGSGSLPYYSGETFARNGDIVVVTLNYRVGPLGFLYFGPDHGEPESGNFWLTDQAAALRWVHENIAHFGGDPDNVTVAGQSGGAISTAALAGHPAAQGLFHRAILQSAPFGLQIPDPQACAEVTETFLKIVGASDVEALRQVPWPRLVEATGALFGATARWGYWPTPFLPVIDGVTLSRHPGETLLCDGGADIEVMIGWTRDESNFSFARTGAGYETATKEQVIGRIADTFGSDASEVYAAYGRTRPGSRPVDVLMDLISDELFRVPSLRLADARAQMGRPAWAYQFDFETPAHQGRLGAAHCLELPFVFNNFDNWSRAPFVEGIEPAARQGLAQSMHQAWISFVRDGNPNHPGLPEWAPYEADTRTTLRFDSVVSAISDLAGHSRMLHSRASR